jgi:mannose-1-phosphate guanylyltransferase
VPRRPSRHVRFRWYFAARQPVSPPRQVSPPPAANIWSVAIHAVVLAGGPGERFWPATTDARPKPFLRLWGGRSLLQETVERAEALTSPERVWVSGAAAYRPLLLAELPPDLARHRLILEPARRDTAAAVGLAALRLAVGDPEALAVFLPADHFVGDLAAFGRAVAGAARAADAGYVVTLGLAPRRPETGYGYIQCGEPLADAPGSGALRVRRFVEKPDAAAALGYVRDPAYLWNCGVVVARAAAVLEATRRHMPELAAGLDTIAARVAAGGLAAWEQAVAEIFPRLPATSFDYGVLQAAANVAVVPTDFPWDDVGSWDALTRVNADPAGNHIHGRAVALDTTRSVLRNESGDRVLVGFGLSDVAVVVTDHAVVAASRERSADWKRMLRVLREGDYGRLIGDGLLPGRGGAPGPGGGATPGASAGGLLALFGGGAGPGGSARERPWGREVGWARTPGYLLRLLELRPGAARVLRRDPGRVETQLFLSGAGRVRVRGHEREVTPGLCLTVRPGEASRIAADSEMRVLAVSARLRR